MNVQNVGQTMNDEILRLIRYEPDTGKLFWNKRVPSDFNGVKRSCDALCVSWNKRFANKEAFTAIGNHGYKTGAVLNKNYLAHRVAWLLQTGKWPEVFIDHINGNRIDNRFCNLREVDYAESSKNISIRSDCSSGYTGVYLRDYGKWTARIKSDGVFEFLGTFDTFDEAYKARKDAERRHGFHENYGRYK